MSTLTKLRAALAVAGLAFGVAAAPALARPDEAFVVIKAGKIITGTGEEIENGEVVIVDGKVRLVGRKLEYPRSAKIIDAPRETVIPGLIHARARPDLSNYATRSGVRGNLKVSEETSLDRIDFEPFLSNGFTTVAIYPQGIQVPGIAGVYHTAGPMADRLLAVPGYLRMTMNSQPRDKGTLRDAIRKAKAEIEKVEKARQEWEAKKKEADAKKKEGAPAGGGGDKPAEPPKEPPKTEQAPPVPPGPNPQPQPTPTPTPAGPPAPATPPAEFKPPEMDAAHRPFIDLLQKKAGAPAIMLEVGKASDYIHATDVLDEEKDEKLLHRFFFISGTPGFADFNYVATKLGDAKARVAMPPVMHRMPNSVARYNLAASLMTAGAEVAFVPTGDDSSDLSTYRARIADISRGVIERNDTIKALTINPARFLGADKLIGSIEKGKNADIVFLDADILDPLAEVTRVMINGEIVWKSKEAKR